MKKSDDPPRVPPRPDADAPPTRLLSRRASRRPSLKAVTAAGLVLAVLAACLLLPITEHLVRVLDWTKSAGPLGPLYLALVYGATCVLFIPGSILTVGSGFAFGLLWGTAAAVAGSLLGVALSFLLGRTVLRGWVEGKVRSSARFRAIDEAVGREGFKIVLLTRLSPIFPFNLLNYAFGATRVSFRDCFLGSWIGMFPGTVMYVYFGTAAKSLADLAAGDMGGGGAAGYALLGAGLAATVAATVAITRIARRALREAIPVAEPGSSGETGKDLTHA
ncbi:MAG: TVP38/TMEM64 family protein [Planctomycetes bacterium]|nr:TVP38/TMEM64 family protein [Planctomycetota bacterium]